MNKIQVDPEGIAAHIESLSKIGNLGESSSDGFLRASWSDEESTAMHHIQIYGEALGLTSRYDAVGNLFLRTKGNKETIVQVGSHLDTVPNGGNYDGAAGIIAGIEAINVLQNGHLKDMKHDLELVVWRGEESGTFGVVYKGSKAAFGIADPHMLKNKFEGQTLEDAILAQGYNPRKILDRDPTLSQEHIDSITAHIELHIEQGTVLEKNKIDIGKVTSIRGPSRYLVLVHGQFDHSGATPMGVKFRRDANLAIAYMQVRIDALAQSYIDSDKDLVQTVSQVNTNPDSNTKYTNEDLSTLTHTNALTKVSGFGYFTLDIRSNNNLFRNAYEAKVMKLIKDVGNEYNVEVKIIPLGSSPALESLSPVVQEAIHHGCEYHNYSVTSLASGAGHDAAVVAAQKRSNGTVIPTGMIFIPCKDGKSHCKEEYTTPEAITKGANVLARAMYFLSR